MPVRQYGKQHANSAHDPQNLHRRLRFPSLAHLPSSLAANRTSPAARHAFSSRREYDAPSLSSLSTEPPEGPPWLTASPSASKKNSRLSTPPPARCALTSCSWFPPPLPASPTKSNSKCTNPRSEEHTS